MATENTKLVAQKLKNEAHKLDEKIQEIAASITRKWDDLGELCAQFRDKELFKYTGFKTLEEWREDRSIGRATMYRAIRIYEALKELPKPERQKINQEKAEHLARLPKEERLSPEWITRAQDKKLSAEAFEGLINKKAKSHGGVVVAEKRKFYKVKGYESQIDFIEESVKEWAKNHSLKDDYGRALELICAEVRSTDNDAKQALLTNISATFNTIMQELNGVREVEKSDMSAEDQLKKVLDANAVMAEALLKMTEKFGAKLTMEGWVKNKQEETKKLKAAKK